MMTRIEDMEGCLVTKMKIQTARRAWRPGRRLLWHLGLCRHLSPGQLLLLVGLLAASVIWLAISVYSLNESLSMTDESLRQIGEPRSLSERSIVWQSGAALERWSSDDYVTSVNRAARHVTINPLLIRPDRITSD